MIRLMTVVLLLGLSTSCGNREKAMVVSYINDYNSFVEDINEQLNKIQTQDADCLFMRVQGVRVAFMDSASYRRKTIALLLKESGLSETNKDELLTRLQKVQNKAFDLYVSIDKRSTEAQVMSLQLIRQQMLQLETANQAEAVQAGEFGSLPIDRKIKEMKKEHDDFVSRINSMRSEMQADKHKILNWDW